MSSSRPPLQLLGARTSVCFTGVANRRSVAVSGRHGSQQCLRHPAPSQRFALRAEPSWRQRRASSFGELRTHGHLYDSQRSRQLGSPASSVLRSFEAPCCRARQRCAGAAGQRADARVLRTGAPKAHHAGAFTVGSAWVPVLASAVMRSIASTRRLTLRSTGRADAGLEVWLASCRRAGYLQR